MTAPKTLRRMTDDNGNADIEASATMESNEEMLPSAELLHDLGNVLSGIRLLAASAGRHVAADALVGQQIATISDSAKHAAVICAQLQSTLHGEGDFEGECRVMDLSATLDGKQVLLEAMIRPDASLKTEWAAELPAISADATRLHRILLDMTLNASEALGPSGGSITIRTGLVEDQQLPEAGSDRRCVTAGETARDQPWVFLEIADTGCGIPEDELPHIFNPSYTRKRDGHGLGLASVLQIVRDFGGAITVASRVGQGTTVRCLFPPAPWDSSPADEAAFNHDVTNDDGVPGPKSGATDRTEPDRTEPDRAGPDRAGPDRAGPGQVTILLVEDVAAVRHGSKLLLETNPQRKFSVLTASNGEEAMNLFRQRLDEIALVVLDMRLPDCQGSQLLRRLRDFDAQLPVIGVSGTPEAELLDADDATVDGFLLKPFDGDALIDKVNAVLHASGRSGREA